MNLTANRLPYWAADEKAELAWDVEMAEKYGLQAKTITAARHDLITYLVTYYEDLFGDYKLLSKNLGKNYHKLCKIADSLEGHFALFTDKQSARFEIEELIGGIRQRAKRIHFIQKQLPRKAVDIRGRAVIYLISIWVHEPRSNGSDGGRTVKMTFDDTEERQHKSVSFIIEMLEHFSDDLLSGVTRSTIMRSWKKIRENVPLPNEVALHEGDAAFFD